MAEEQSAHAIVISSCARRDLKKLKNNRIVLSSIDKSIRSLSANPRPPGIEHLKGNSYRLRDGDYRILYDVDDANKSVEIIRVRDRKDVYRKYRK